MATQLANSNNLRTENVCMLFTDIEGSTGLVDAYGDIYPTLLSRHNQLLRNAIESHGGKEVNVSGDSVFALFPGSKQGVEAAIDAQLAIDKEEWIQGQKLKVRMGLHSGKVQRHESVVVGIEVHRAARISSVAHGGQIVISHAVRDDITKSAIQPGIKIRDLGFHRLKDLRYPEALFDLVVPGLPSDFAPISSIGANRTNLSLDPEAFFGREAEIERARNLILQDERRLVTFTGPGGAGKTSLALAVARSLLEHFSRGVFFVQLGNISSPDLIPSAICQTLGIQQYAGISAIETMRNSIGDAHLLLILDTFEHVVAGAPTITVLIKECPYLTCIVTSREALGVRAEAEIAVGPLPLPEEGATFDEVSQNPSVQLFVELAQRERSDFKLTAELAPEIVHICRRLDGLPLAIELAASHIGVMEPAALSRRLATSLHNLKHKARDVDPRHRTLRGAIRWSEDLLTQAQREAFQRLSVFIGGFDIEAAEHVLAPQFGSDDVVDHLEALLAKSLVYRRMALGRPRLHLLDTIRDYAWEGLSRSDSLSECQARHAGYFSNLVTKDVSKVTKHNQRDYVERLFEETGNIRAALEWLMKQPSAHETARLFCALRWFWISRGQFSEAERWTEAALAQARHASEPRPLAAILDAAGWIRYMAGDPAKGHEFSTESHRLFVELGDQQGEASSGIISGLAKVTLGEDLEAGVELISRSLQLFRALGDDYGAVVALIAFGEGARSEGDEETAEQYYQEALSLLDGLGDTYWPGHLSQNLAHFRLHQGDWKEAARLASDALAISERYDYPMVVNLATAAISGVFLAKGAAHEAAWMIGAVQARLERLGVGFEPTDNADFQRIIIQARHALGEEQFASAASKGAAASWEDVLALARSSGQTA